jgi:hypothetical protein
LWIYPDEAPSYYQPIVILSHKVAKNPYQADLKMVSSGILRPLRGLRKTAFGDSCVFV